jgi:lipopolysaccharide transport system ATP-binding protein
MRIYLNEVIKTFRVTGGKTVAVDGVSLEVNFGERVGIIGPNGAGKTTLLQIIAGIIKPTSGLVEVKGHVNCIMTLGVGLREELSGRDNIYIDAELNSKSRQEVDKVIEDIITFADIGEFIDYPVRTYSTGMKSRLAFAMNIFLEPGILIIDEALSAGDTQFSAKATEKMREICTRGKILVLVSHSMASIVNMCDRCIWMDEGKIVMYGNSNSVTKAYLESVRKREEKRMEDLFKRSIGATSIHSDFGIKKMEFLDGENCPKRIFRVGEKLKILISIKAATELKRPDIRVIFERLDGNIFSVNLASDDGFEVSPIESEAIFEVSVDSICFGQDTYEVHVELLDRDRPGENAVLAKYHDVLKIEETKSVIDNPAYFATVDWTSKSIESERNF